MKRDAIEFSFVRPGHEAIHEHLMNWSRWCRGSGHGANVHPMFRQYRNDYFEPGVATQECDTLGAIATQKAFTGLPEKHRWVLSWAYCKPYIPVMRVRQALGLTTPALSELLHDSRTMMKNTRQV